MINTTKNDKRRAIIGISIPVLILAALLVAFHGVPMSWQVNGPSMEPNYDNGSRVLATRSDSNPSIDSVVIIKFPDPKVAATTYGIKRIVALGGDRVVINNNELTVCDSQHPNGYNPTSNVIASGVTTTGNIDITVPRGDVYVLGDNRTNSLDSREFGPLPKSNIVGKVLVKI